MGTTEFSSGRIYCCVGPSPALWDIWHPSHPTPNVRGMPWLLWKQKYPSYISKGALRGQCPPTHCSWRPHDNLYLFLLLSYALQEGRHLTFHWSVLPAPSTVPGATRVPVIWSKLKRSPLRLAQRISISWPTLYTGQLGLSPTLPAGRGPCQRGLAFKCPSQEEGICLHTVAYSSATAELLITAGISAHLLLSTVSHRLPCSHARRTGRQVPPTCGGKNKGKHGLTNRDIELFIKKIVGKFWIRISALHLEATF